VGAFADFKNVIVYLPKIIITIILSFVSTFLLYLCTYIGRKRDSTIFDVDVKGYQDSST